VHLFETVHLQEIWGCYTQAMREPRVKLSLRPTLPALQQLLDRVRALPWPAPLQRLTTRGLSKLKERLPGLAELLDGFVPPSAARAPAPPVIQHADAPKPPEPALIEGLVGLLSAPDYQRRLKAAGALGLLHQPAALDPLIGALRDRSVEVACAAASAIAATGGERAQDALLTVLANADGFYHTLTRAAATYGLGHSALRGAPPRYVRARLEQALRDRDAEVSIAAIGALSERYRDTAGDALREVLENRDGFFLPATRLAAARAFGRLGPHTNALLDELCAREGDDAVRSVLTGLRTPAAVG
jgi:HEAT repeat protein